MELNRHKSNDDVNPKIESIINIISQNISYHEEQVSILKQELMIYDLILKCENGGIIINGTGDLANLIENDTRFTIINEGDLKLENKDLETGRLEDLRIPDFNETTDNEEDISELDACEFKEDKVKKSMFLREHIYNLFIDEKDIDSFTDDNITLIPIMIVKVNYDIIEVGSQGNFINDMVTPID